MLLELSGGALAEDKTIGVLSFLNLTEEKYETMDASMRKSSEGFLLHGVMEKKESRVPAGPPAFHYYDTLDAMLMGLQA